MKTIIAATDFSPISVNAVEYAAGLAKVIGANLCIVHICASPITETPVRELAQKEIFDDAKEKMYSLKEKITLRESKINITTELLEGETVSCLSDFCEKVDPYAVVMGAESGNAYERFLFGAKTIDSMRRLRYPLIVIPAGSKFSKLCRIGLACDLKDAARTLPFNEIKTLVNEFHAELHVLHISNQKPGEFNTNKVTEYGDLHEMLLPMNPIYDFIRGDDVEEEVIKFAEKNRIDLLIVIPKYDEMMYRIFQQSHSQRLVLHAHVPVLSLHSTMHQ
jgi:nucleotide-binding universal stress UspA family protein